MSTKRELPEERFRRILFGEGLNEVITARLSHATGISESTLRNWKRRPAQISLEGAVLIARARGLNEEQILALF